MLVVGRKLGGISAFELSRLDLCCRQLLPGSSSDSSWLRHIGRMLTYIVRQRGLYPVPEGGPPAEFPNLCEFRFQFQPATPFGGEAEPGRTAVQGKAGTSTWDSNTGRTYITPAEPMARVDVTIEHGGLTACFDGNVLVLRGTFEDRRQLENALEAIYYLLPAVLTLEFLDAPRVVRVTGRVGEAEFVWALLATGHAFEVTNTERQEKRLADSWNRMLALMPMEKRRLASAVCYFSAACRLELAGDFAWEFLSDILLNLAKVLETLFPPSGDIGSIDASRAGLRSLGMGDEQIERDFIPVLALRNALDVGHPSLAVFHQTDLEVVQRYCQSVIAPFRAMLADAFAAVEHGRLVLAPFEREPRREVVRVIEQIRSRMGE